MGQSSVAERLALDIWETVVLGIILIVGWVRCSTMGLGRPWFENTIPMCTPQAEIGAAVLNQRQTFRILRCYTVEEHVIYSDLMRTILQFRKER